MRAGSQVKGGRREVSALGSARRWVGALPLRWRLALGYALVLLLALAPLTALQFVAVHALLFNNTRESLRAAVLADARAVAKPSRAGNGTVAPRTGPGITAILVDASGHASVVAAAENEQTPGVSSLVRLPDIDRALSGNPAVPSTYQAATARGPYLVALAVLPPPRGKRLAIRPRRGGQAARSPGTLA